MNFELQHTDPQTKARAGKITTDHGEILTPIFMPVGTLGSVKAVHQHELRDDIKAQIILGNTYHLYLRPGDELLARAVEATLAAGGDVIEGWALPGDRDTKNLFERGGVTARKLIVSKRLR